MAVSGIVQYWVMKRPKNDQGRIIYGAELGSTKDAAGKVYYGETLLINNGDTVETINPAKSQHQRNSMTDVADTIDPTIITPTFDEAVLPGSKYEPIVGQPWVLHSVHFGVDDALKSAKPLIIANGEDNVKICKILSHETIVKMA